MKGARNVLVLKWKRFLPHRPLKGTQTPRDLQTIVRELQRWVPEVRVNTVLEMQEENTRTLAFIFIFKLRLIKFYEYFMYEFTLMHLTTGLSVLNHHVILKEELCSTSQWGVATPLFSHWKFLCMNCCMFYLLISTYDYLPEFKSYEDTLSIFFSLSVNVRLHLFLIIPSLERFV